MVNCIDNDLKNIIIVNSRKNISTDDINDNSDLINDFSYDSILVMQLIIDCESKFGIEFQDEDMELEILTKYLKLKNLINSKIGLETVKGD